MYFAHGWGCRKLQRFFNELEELEDLRLTFPTCCGPHGIDFSATHPKLKTFSLTSNELCAPSDFFDRHHSLESLELYTLQSFIITESSLRGLKALSIDRDTLRLNPAFLSFHAPTSITHLRLRMPHLSLRRVSNAVIVVSQTLRCLELDEVDQPAFAKLLVKLADLMKRIPCLLELGILGGTYHCTPADWTPDDLVSLRTYSSLSPFH